MLDSVRRSDAHLARLYRQAQTGGWEWDLVTRKAVWSPEALAVFGRPGDASPLPLDDPPYDVHPGDAQRHADLILALTVECRPAEGEYRIVTRDGSIRYVRMAGEPEPDGQDAPSLVCGLVQDITRQRQTEIALEVAQVQLAAQRTRVDTEQRLGTLLQQAILPAGPVALSESAGLRVATRYRQATALARVGGDWYDVFHMPHDQVLLAVGDIAGHGLAATAAMARLHHALHGLAITCAEPGRLLGWLNEITCTLPTFTIASVCGALFDPATKVLRWANGGHPPPILVRDGEARPLVAPVGPVLGADRAAVYAAATERLAPGDVLLMFTDGLIERRRFGPDENLHDLLVAAADPPRDLGAYLDRLLDHTQPDTDDDTCLIAVRVA